MEGFRVQLLEPNPREGPYTQPPIKVYANLNVVIR